MKTFLCIVLVMLIIAGYISAQPATQASTTADQLLRLERAEAKLKDWPNLGRYREANSKIAPPAKGEDRVVFIGDSITDSWKLNEYFPGRPYINRGISGQTTPQMLIRFRPDVIALWPQVVVIFAGTNDIAGNTGPMSVETIQDNLHSMAELARANGIRVVMASILPVSDYNKNSQGVPIVRTTARPPEKILTINQLIRKYADHKRFVYLDYFSAMVDSKGFLREELAGDGLHPNQKGYEIMKPLAEEAIRKAFQQKR